MKTPKNNIKNPQKQGQSSILGYFNGPKLYRRQINQTLMNSSQSKNQRRSPIYIKKYQNEYQSNYNQSPLTARSSYISQKNRGFEETNQSGFYSSRKKSNKQKDNIKTADNSKIKRQNLPKNQLNSVQRKRFYYKKEYDFDSENEEKYQQMSQKSQYQTILPNYFSKINDRTSKIQSLNLQEKNSKRQKRSLSPLEESHQKLFAKCYKETSYHLDLMLKEVHQSQKKLDFVHQEILDNIYDTVKSRASFLRSQLIETVEKILDEWQQNQWQFIKRNEILFLDDILELKEQINEKELKINLLIQKLEKQKSLSWTHNLSSIQTSENALEVENIWKNVTTDLLMFNHENSIIQIQELSDKILYSVSQKCIKAIDILLSSQIYKNANNKIQKSDTITNLKNSINQIISQISHSQANFSPIQSLSIAPKDHYDPNYSSKQNGYRF